MFEPVAAAPPVPEFTLSLQTFPYEVAPTTSIDPYTNKTTTILTGYSAENFSIVITIKNQVYNTDSYSNDSGSITYNNVGLYYNVRYKGHYGDTWKAFPADQNSPFTVASNSEHTTISLSVSQLGISEGGKADFEVQAMIGHMEKIQYDEPLLPMKLYYYEFTGETSPWSSTQTIIIENAAATTTPTATMSPSTPTPTAIPTTAVSPTENPSVDYIETDKFLGVDWESAAILILVIVVVVLTGVLIFSRKTSKKKR